MTRVLGSVVRGPVGSGCLHLESGAVEAIDVIIESATDTTDMLTVAVPAELECRTGAIEIASHRVVGDLVATERQAIRRRTREVDSTLRVECNVRQRTSFGCGWLSVPYPGIEPGWLRLEAYAVRPVRRVREISYHSLFQSICSKFYRRDS